MYFTAPPQPEKQLLKRGTAADLFKLRLLKYECRIMKGHCAGKKGRSTLLPSSLFLRIVPLE